MQLKVSDNGRFLQYEDGKPFFYLADTAWEMFHRLSREDAEHYLRDRASKGYTVIQAVALAEHEFEKPNARGHFPLQNNDVTKPDAGYFEDVDWMIRKAGELGLFIGLLPTWGDKWNTKWAKGKELFTPENARIYGEWIGKRYAKTPNIIWILGGDRPVDNDTHRAIIEAMATGIKASGDTHLMTFHTFGGHSSSAYFPDALWLDFHMWQTGHERNRKSYEMIESDYNRTPAKPVLDGEPGYEDHFAGFNLNNGFLDDYENRKSLYWALFAGACGHAYGCHAVWQMCDPERWRPIAYPRRHWKEAIQLPGAAQMQHARKLLESRAYFSRIPAQDIIVGSKDEGTAYKIATRDANGTYALIYSPAGHPFEVDMTKLSGKAKAAWFNPRTGESKAFGEYSNQGTQKFTPPAFGPDWILTLDVA